MKTLLILLCLPSTMLFVQAGGTSTHNPLAIYPMGYFFTTMVATTTWMMTTPTNALNTIRRGRKRPGKPKISKRGRICGTQPRPLEDISAVLKHEQEWLARKARYSNIVTFNIVFNVLRTSSGEYDIPTSVILKQMEVLNTAYAGGDNKNGFTGQIDTNVRWRLVGINRYATSRAGTCGDEGPIDNAISNAYRVQGTVFNVYTCNLKGDLLGYTYLPCGSGKSARQMYLKWNTMSSVPGANYVAGAGYDGDTLTHECGHFLGLDHTFQGGCSTPGDFVADTPEEATAYYGTCPPGSSALQRNTCPAPGFDYIQSFMDYSEDICMDRFSPGQADRMQSEVDRCESDMKDAVPPCWASGTVGTATQYSTCYTDTCRTDAMPNGATSPPTGWCYTYGGSTPGTLWGPCQCDGGAPSPVPSPTVATNTNPPVKGTRPTTQAPSTIRGTGPTTGTPVARPTRNRPHRPTHRPTPYPTPAAEYEYEY